jgi:hypothetical protein
VLSEADTNSRYGDYVHHRAVRFLDLASARPLGRPEVQLGWQTAIPSQQPRTERRGHEREHLARGDGIVVAGSLTEGASRLGDNTESGSNGEATSVSSPLLGLTRRDGTRLRATK